MARFAAHSIVVLVKEISINGRTIDSRPGCLQWATNVSNVCVQCDCCCCCIDCRVYGCRISKDNARQRSRIKCQSSRIGRHTACVHRDRFRPCEFHKCICHVECVNSSTIPGCSADRCRIAQCSSCSIWSCVIEGCACISYSAS